MMLNEMKIASKITFMMITIVFVVVVFLGFMAYYLSSGAIVNSGWESLQLISNLKKKEIEQVFEMTESKMSFYESSSVLIKNLERSRFINPASRDTLLQQAASEVAPFFEDISKDNSLFSSAFLITDSKQILYIHSSEDVKKEYELGVEVTSFREYIEKVNDLDQGQVIYSQVIKGKNQEKKLYAIRAIYNQEQHRSGYIILELNLNVIFKSTNDLDYNQVGLGSTGEIILGGVKNVNTLEAYNVFRKDSTELHSTILLGEGSHAPLEKALLERTSGRMEYVDYKNDKAFAVFTFIPNVNWGLVVKIDKSEIDKDLNKAIIYFVFFIFLVIIIVAGISIFYSNNLISPLLNLKQILNKVSQGELPTQVKREASDEIGQMADAINDLVNALRRTVTFAYEIGEGDYDADFEPISNNDILGNALIAMRDSIQDADNKDNERNWIVSGVAEMGRLLREQNDLEALGDSIIAFVTTKIDAIQGAFYVVSDEDGDGYKKASIELIASYAYHRKKYLQASFHLSEGLVGQCVVEQDIILRTEIPSDYLYITSGLIGEQKPKCLLFVPLITDEKVYGVMEFAGLERFSEKHIQFVKEISVLIARTIFNIKVNQKTLLLLQESQQMHEELQFQQEILRQNAEEMEMTQEQLKNTNTRLEEQILEVSRTQKRMQVLLENASEVITIYEKDRTIRYISPSVLPILEYSQEEMIGIQDISFVVQENRSDVINMFDNLLEYPDERVTIQFQYMKKNGESIWVESTGTNLLGDPAIKGIVLNTRDITEKRRAEKEERRRGQMQSLSEHSPDLIMRVSTEGMVYYINPTIRNLTGLRSEHFINRKIDEVGLNRKIIEGWLKVIHEVQHQGAKLSAEMEFPAVMGDLVMQVNAIPEINEKGDIETILFVSHDITERKMTEIAIRETNKKISESINYARRIQGAILPHDNDLRRIFPDSFIFYMPRDVVSGDFPWMFVDGDNAYVAVVDCTGHGVPGALISLIGYFILERIISTHKNLNPGEILDLLNEGVTQTLKQETEDATKDGMDIALCKIDIKNQVLDYAGAHRPLYLIRANGEFEQVKGDKFPIGGGNLQYRNRTNFCNTQLQYEHGDSLYIFSDGLPDQFGGDSNRKFSPRRIRDMIMDHYQEDMNTVYHNFVQIVDDWKGDQRQTDDILLIGIKF